MTPRKCAACGAVLPESRPDSAGTRTVAVRLTVRASGRRRTGDFELCGPCSRFDDSTELTGYVRAALLAELRTLLR